MILIIGSSVTLGDEPIMKIINKSEYRRNAFLPLPLSRVVFSCRNPKLTTLKTFAQNFVISKHVLLLSLLLLLYVGLRVVFVQLELSANVIKKKGGGGKALRQKITNQTKCTRELYVGGGRRVIECSKLK